MRNYWPTSVTECQCVSTERLKSWHIYVYTCLWIRGEVTGISMLTLRKWRNVYRLLTQKAKILWLAVLRCTYLSNRTDVSMSSTGRRVSSVFSVDHSNITPSSLYNGSTSVRVTLVFLIIISIFLLAANSCVFCAYNCWSMAEIQLRWRYILPTLRNGYYA